MKIVEPEENTLAMALKRFAAWKHYREHDAVMAETQELIDGMLLLEAYAALEARCRELLNEYDHGRDRVRDLETDLANKQDRIAKLEESEARCLFLEERLRDINEYNQCGPKDKDIERVLIAAFPAETDRQPGKYAAHHPQCEWRKFEGQAICNCADLALETFAEPGVGPIEPEPQDYKVQCRCGWMGSVSTLKSLPEFKMGCPDCSQEFVPFNKMTFPVTTATTAVKHE